MKFLHTADLHLGMKYSTEYPEALRKKLMEDEKNIILRIINLASEKSIPYIFICGDLFDTHKPDKEIADFVISSFESYKGKIYIIPGNHDFNGPESVYSVRKFPSNVHIFGNEISVIEEEELYIYGFGFGAPHKTDNSLSEFVNLKKDKPSVLLIHTDFKSDSCYNPVSFSELEAAGFSYVAAGHIHKPDDVVKRGNTIIAQSGVPRGLNFKENDDSGVYIITLEDGFLSSSRERVYCNRYRNGIVDISSASSFEDVKKLCLDYIMAEEPGISLVNITLAGKLKPDIVVDEKHLTEYLSSSCLYLRLNCEYSVLLDIELLKQENSARGEFVRRALSSFPDKDEAFILKVIEKGVDLL